MKLRLFLALLIHIFAFHTFMHAAQNPPGVEAEAEAEAEAGAGAASAADKHSGIALVSPAVRKELAKMRPDDLQHKLFALKNRVVAFSSDLKSVGVDSIVGPMRASDGKTFDYHLYVPAGYWANPTAALPVVFVVYGGGIPINFWPPEHSLSPERMLAMLGCVVVTFRGEEIPKEESVGGLDTRINHTNFPGRLFLDLEEMYVAMSKAPESGGLYRGPYIKPGETKVFLFGGSFGGYVTALTATTPPYNKLFDGYISNHGVYDHKAHSSRSFESSTLDAKSHAISHGEYCGVHLFDFSHSKKQPAHQRTYFCKKSFVKDDCYNRKISPLYHVDKLKRPLLLCAGMQDENVHPEQTFEFLKSARLAGKSYLVDGHFLKNGGHEFTPMHLNMIMDFIEKVLNNFSGSVEVERKEALSSRAYDEAVLIFLNRVARNFKYRRGAELIEMEQRRKDVVLKKEIDSKQSIASGVVREIAATDLKAPSRTALLTTLDLSELDLNRDEAIQLARVARFPGVRIVNLSHNPKLGVGGVAAILGALQDKDAVTTLDLSATGLRSAEAALLASILGSFTNLKVFKLSSNGALGSIGVATLLGAIPNKASVLELDLNYLRLRDADTRTHIIPVLRLFTSATQINLDKGNSIDWGRPCEP
jgi:hypothetical protein